MTWLLYRVFVTTANLIRAINVELFVAKTLIPQTNFCQFDASRCVANRFRPTRANIDSNNRIIVLHSITSSDVMTFALIVIEIAPMKSVEILSSIWIIKFAASF